MLGRFLYLLTIVFCMLACKYMKYTCTHLNTFAQTAWTAGLFADRSTIGEVTGQKWRDVASV